MLNKLSLENQALVIDKKENVPGSLSKLLYLLLESDGECKPLVLLCTTFQSMLEEGFTIFGIT